MCSSDLAQIDRANAVSLEDFLRTQGETLIKSGREYRWKEHDSLTVRGNKWFRHSQSKGGYPIDFVIEFYGKMCIRDRVKRAHCQKQMDMRIAIPFVVDTPISTCLLYTSRCV